MAKALDTLGDASFTGSVVEQMVRKDKSEAEGLLGALAKDDRAKFMDLVTLLFIGYYIL